MSTDKTTSEQDAPNKSSTPLKAPRWLLWVFAGLIVLGSGIAYSGGLDNGFTNWDDNWLITDNRHIRGVTWENAQYWFNPMAPREELGNEYLPIRDLSYAINYELDGYNATGYHATNLLLHIFVSLLVMLFAYRLTGRKWIGGFAGLLFALHPVHVEAVSWLSSRKDLLATFFLMLSANLYLSARRSRTGLMSSESFVQRVRESTRLSYFLALLFFVFALLSKMTAVVLPALLLLIELFRGSHLRSMSIGKRAGVQAPFWGIAVLFTALASHIGSGLMREPYGDGKYESLLTATSAITRDFQVLFAGYPLHAAVDLPVQTGWTLPVFLGALILLILIGVGVLAWRKAGAWDSQSKMALGVAGFSALWFLVALAPVSNFVVQIGTVFAERYLYIPSIGFCIAIAALGVILVERLRQHPVVGVGVVPAAALLWGCLVSLYIGNLMDATKQWSGSTVLWKTALEHDPGNHIAHFNLGRVYQEQALLEPDDAKRDELFDRADAQYELALENPARTYRYDPARVYGALALNRVHQNEPEKALALLDQAAANIDLPWRDDEARRDIEALLANPRGLALSALGRHDEAIAAFEEAIAKSDRYAGARVNLATELTRAALENEINEDKLNRAKRELAEYLKLHGRTAMYVEARGRMLLAEFDARLKASGKGGEGDIPADLRPLLDESKELYRELVDLRGEEATPKTAMAATLIEAADAHGRGAAGDETAERYLRRALKLRPEYLGLRYLLAQLLFEKAASMEESGKSGAPTRVEATKFLAEELNRNPDYQPAKSLKAAGLRQRAVNEAHALVTGWREEYAISTGDEGAPTWPALIREFKDREQFRTALILITTLMREAIELDPANDESHGLVEGSGLQIALGMWWTFDPEFRAHAEELLRTTFNARPMDSVVSDMLTRFYLELAEQVIGITGNETTEEARRAELDALLANMLTLSERARRILSTKLYKVGRKVETGDTKLKGDGGNELELSEFAARMAASEFVRAATILNPENIEALDWLKEYYETEGDFDEALEVFGKLIDALGDRPELMHGVYLSLAQLQLDFGQQLVRSFKHKLRLGLDEEAQELRDKAVQAYLDCIDTTGKLLDNPENPEKVNLPVRLRGIAAQRLAYLHTEKAEEYYTIALEAYARMPLDFEEEIREVRRKRSWFVRDPYKRLDELRAIVQDAGPEVDVTDMREDIINLERRIARIEAKDLLEDGKPGKALKRLEAGMRAPTPQLFAVRGEAYEMLARQQSDSAERERLLVIAAKDLVRGVTEPEALIAGGLLYWEEPALMFEEDRITRSRTAFTEARDVLETSIITLDKGSADRVRYRQLLETASTKLKELQLLGDKRLNAVRILHRDGKLDEAMEFVDGAIEYLGDHAPAYQWKGYVTRDIGRRDGDALYIEEARRAFSTALRMDIPLPTLRATLLLDMAELWARDIGDNSEAGHWYVRAMAAIDTIDPDRRDIYTSRAAEIQQLLRE